MRQDTHEDERPQPVPLPGGASLLPTISACLRLLLLPAAAAALLLAWLGAGPHAIALLVPPVAHRQTARFCSWDFLQLWQASHQSTNHGGLGLL